MKKAIFLSRRNGRLFGGLNANQKKVASFCIVFLVVLMAMENWKISSTKHGRSLQINDQFDSPLQIAIDDHATMDEHEVPRFMTRADMVEEGGEETTFDQATMDEHEVPRFMTRADMVEEGEEAPMFDQATMDEHEVPRFMTRADMVEEDGEETTFDQATMDEHEVPRFMTRVDMVEEGGEETTFDHAAMDENVPRFMTKVEEGVEREFYEEAPIFDHTAMEEQEIPKLRLMTSEGEEGKDGEDGEINKGDFISIEQTSTEESKPVMHTFYQKDHVGEDDLLEYWGKAWEKAGWDTVVLTLEDAQKHPYYNEMFSIIDPLWGMTYNGFCFYRWLAMAASGGGWMSDYDLFPTNFPKEEGFMDNLPNGGNFTTFEAHVPSLMSGSEEEWLRVSKLLVDALKEDRVEYAFKSDMYTFLQLRMEGAETHDIDFRIPAYNVNHGFVYKTSHEVDCEEMDLARAVHLSHHFTSIAFKDGLFPLEVGGFIGKRGPAAQVFLAEWQEQCGGSLYERDVKRVLH